MGVVNERSSELTGRGLRHISLLGRQSPPFVETRDAPGFPIMIFNIRHEYPLFVGTSHTGQGVEAWRMYIEDKERYYKHLGQPVNNPWSGSEEIEAYRIYRYRKEGRRIWDIEDDFITERASAIGLGIPLNIVDEMFTERPKLWTVSFVESPNSWATKKYTFT